MDDIVAEVPVQPIMPVPEMAVLMITLDGETGQLADPINYDTPDDEVKRVASEAVSGGLQGITAQQEDFADFIVDRVPAKDGLPDRINLRPKTAFGHE